MNLDLHHQPLHVAIELAPLVGRIELRDVWFIIYRIDIVTVAQSTTTMETVLHAAETIPPGAPCVMMPTER